MPLSGFHPVIERWFGARFAEPTEPQRRAWPVMHAGRNALIAAPTGSGKTFAAFLAAIDSLLRQGLEGTLRDETQVVYVSPLKALSNDVQKNLAEPLAEIRRTLEAMCLPDVEIRTLVRTGDTPAAERQAMVKRPPHILVTTPESLYLILTSEHARDMLRTVRTIIVDEIHAVARDKRGSHLALSLERLEHLAGRQLQRVGLSATQKPIEEIAAFLAGVRHQALDTSIIDSGHARALDLAIEIPSSPPDAGRRPKERRRGAGAGREGGQPRPLGAPAALELGAVPGAADLACRTGSTRSSATPLQRGGRAGHRRDAIAKGPGARRSRDI